MSDVLFYLRTLEIRTGALQSIVYAVKRAPGAKQDPVPALGAFPEHWRPTPRAGEVFFDRECTATYFECEVPRSQFRHYKQITTAEARRLYPEIIDMMGSLYANQLPVGRR